MIHDANARTRHPGIQPFSCGANDGPGRAGLIREVLAGAVSRPRVTETAPMASIVGARLSGTSSVAYAARSHGIRLESAGCPAPPTFVQIVEAGWIEDSRPEIWIKGEKSPYVLEDMDGRTVVSVSVPLAAMTIDLSGFDLSAGMRVPVPPLALHTLQALYDTLTTRDVIEWTAVTPSAIDRYLVGVASLVIGAIMDEDADLDDHGHSWLRTRATTLIETRYHDPTLAPATVASRLGVSMRSLYRAYEGRPGIAEELRRRRVAHAADILADVRTADVTLAEVAVRSGFASFSSFARAFAAAYGMPPQRFRRQHAGTTARD